MRWQARHPECANQRRTPVHFVDDIWGSYARYQARHPEGRHAENVRNCIERHMAASRRMIRSETHEETKLRLDVISRAAAVEAFVVPRAWVSGVSKGDWFRDARGDSRSLAHQSPHRGQSASFETSLWKIMSCDCGLSCGDSGQTASGRHQISSSVTKPITLRDAADLRLRNHGYSRSGGPQGDVLGYALRNPHVIQETDRCEVLVTHESCQCLRTPSPRMRLCFCIFSHGHFFLYCVTMT